MGYVEITSAKGLEKGSTPVTGGVFDLHLGASGKIPCAVCKLPVKRCLGHHGFYTLRYPVLNPLAITHVGRWLKVICIKCGTYMHPPGAGSLEKAATASLLGKTCPTCGNVKEQIEKVKSDYFSYDIFDQTKDHRYRLLPHNIERLFMKVSQEVAKSLHTIHPSKYVLRIISIPPSSIRAPLIDPEMARGDITSLYQQIINQNESLPSEIPHEDPATSILPIELQAKIDALQDIYFTIIHGTSQQATPAHAGTGATKRAIVTSVVSVLRSIQGKQRLVRGNILGKRAFQTARTVIVGDTRVPIDAVRIPLSFARRMQIEETVRPYNYRRLLMHFLNGTKVYPGATRLIKGETGIEYDIGKMLSHIPLQIGDRILRDVVTGDYAYYNRPPTLTRTSIGVHRVIVDAEEGDRLTFGMNVAACSLYNADFDGDQMLLFPPRSVQARIECELGDVNKNFISEKDSSPIIGQTQDTVVGAYLLSRENVAMLRHIAMQIFNYTDIKPTFKQPGKSKGYIAKPTSADIIGELLKTTPINYTKSTRFYSDLFAKYIEYDDYEKKLVIKNGSIEQGVFDKKSVAVETNGTIYHSIAKEFGPKTAMRTVFAMQQVILQYMHYCGFTVAGGDLLITKEAQEEINFTVSKMYEEAETVTSSLLSQSLIPPIGVTVHDHAEQLYINALRTPDAILAPILKSISLRTNGLALMIATGSKGNNPYLIQIMGLVGLVLMNGARLPEGGVGFRRSLIYYPRFDTSPDAAGFNSGSYVRGVTPAQFIASAQAGRADLISKALSTATTGHLTRETIMGSQSVISDNFRRSVLNTSIVQFLYGENAIDTKFLEQVRFDCVTMDIDTLRENYYDPDYEDDYKQLMSDRRKLVESLVALESTNSNMPASSEIMVAINVRKVVQDAELRFTRSATSLPKLSKIAYARLKSELIEGLPYLLSNELQEKKRATLPSYYHAAMFLIILQIRCELCPKKVKTMLPEQVDYVIREVRQRVISAIIDYGEPVAIRASHAVGEPYTQMMLDSAHGSVARGSSKAGIIKIDEVTNAVPVEKEKTSTMIIRVLPELQSDRKKVEEIAGIVEELPFKRFISSYLMLFESITSLVFKATKSDEEWIKTFFKFNKLIRIPKDMTNWCIRFEINKTEMLLKSISLEHIVTMLRESFPNLLIINTPEATEKIIVRAWLRTGMFKKITSQEDIVHQVYSDMIKSIVRGIPNIRNTTVEKIVRHRIGDDGELVLEPDVYAIHAYGTNIRGVCRVKGVWAAKIYSSSIDDTFRTFGIEAARAKIIAEFISSMGDSAPSTTHLMLLADLMTSTGVVLPLTKRGPIVREPTNTLLHVAHAAPIKQLVPASLRRYRNEIYGVAAPMLVGDLPKVGTVFNDVIIDEDFVKEHVPSIEKLLPVDDVS